MAFDFDALNDACLGIGDDCIWQSASGPVELNIIINHQPETSSSDSYEVMQADAVIGETKASLISSMKRGDQITSAGVSYRVIGWMPVGQDWAQIQMEKV